MALVTLLAGFGFYVLRCRFSDLVNRSRRTVELTLMNVGMAKGAPLLRIIFGLSTIGMTAVAWLAGVPATQIKASNAMVKPRLIPPDW